MPQPEWRRLNRLHWEDRVAIHLGPRGDDLDRLRAGQTRLNIIEAGELPLLLLRRGMARQRGECEAGERERRQREGMDSRPHRPGSSC